MFAHNSASYLSVVLQILSVQIPLSCGHIYITVHIYLVQELFSLTYLCMYVQMCILYIMYVSVTEYTHAISNRLLVVIRMCTTLLLY